jgi:cation transport ATPase
MHLLQLSSCILRRGRGTPTQEIARYVEDAQARQAPVQRFADRVVGPFAGGVMTLSVATGAMSPPHREREAQ